MDNKIEIKISVRNLIEFILRYGSIDSRFTGPNRAVEGTKAHKKIQKSQNENYTAEVSLQHTIEFEDYTLIIDGRADGIIKDNDNNHDKITIDEIKTTTLSLDELSEDHNLLHWAQAKCYAYIYSLQNELSEISVQLTYSQLDTEEIIHFIKDFSFKELKEFFDSIIEKYKAWADFSYSWKITRNESIKELSFPFQSYRKGQRNFSVGVYKTICDKMHLFAQAPTGTGKTISTLFPSVMALLHKDITRIFYLTAKTISRQVAREAVALMQKKGLKLKTVILTAKEKICFMEEAVCNKDKCPYANGHFDRVNEALFHALNSDDIFDKASIEKTASEYMVCPFELSLDIALWMDCIVCDYNYVFDPAVNLKRFFTNVREEYIFLIDEAHNLVDRSREMFSAQIEKKAVLELKKSFKGVSNLIYKALNSVNSYMIKVGKKCEEDSYFVQKEGPSDFYPLLQILISVSEKWLVENQKSDLYKDLLNLYFQAITFLRISELYDDHYSTFITKDYSGIAIKLFCLDPSALIGECLKRASASVFFSATLSPIKYFREILGGTEDDYTLRIPSPFDRKNLCIMVCDGISTKYKNRESSYNLISQYIFDSISCKTGNYLVFFPSYKYLNEVYNVFIEKHPQIATIVQGNSMTEEEKEGFLQNFSSSNTQTLLGFAVMGGIFSEGIDLEGDRLIGSIIIGVGLPQICLERNIICDYFNDKNNSGFEFSYMYPGMNKVLQSAGRVIRSENDRGFIFLIDERFTSRAYQQLFPAEWFPYIKVNCSNDICSALNSFWNS